MAIIERYSFLQRPCWSGSCQAIRKIITATCRPCPTGLVNRFCLPKYSGPGEFNYYLDSPASLATLKKLASCQS
jgi:hypothetical protein